MGRHLSVVLGTNVTRQPGHDQANHANRAAKRLTQLLGQLGQDRGEPALIEKVSVSVVSVLAETETDGHRACRGYILL